MILHLFLLFTHLTFIFAFYPIRYLQYLVPKVNFITPFILKINDRSHDIFQLSWDVLIYKVEKQKVFTEITLFLGYSLITFSIDLLLLYIGQKV